MKKKKSPLKALLVLLASVLLGFGIGIVLGVVFIKYIEESIWFLPVLIGIFILTLWLQTVIHELGHLLFGLMSGYRFSSFRIFNFMILKTDGKTEFKRLHVAGTGGQCLMVPPENQNKRTPYVLYNLGGCFLNLITAFLSALILIFVWEIKIPLMILLPFAFSGALIALMNGVPLSTGMVCNDGMNTYILSKDSRSVDAFVLQLKINERVSRGERLKELPAQWFELPSEEGMKNTHIATLAVFAENRLMDEHRFDEARELTERLLSMESGIIGLHRSLLVCDLLYLEAIGECRKEVIEKLLTKEQKQFMGSMKSFLTVARTSYVLALCGAAFPEKTEMHKKYFDKSIKSYPYESDKLSECELVKIAEEKFGKGQA